MTVKERLDAILKDSDTQKWARLAKKQRSAPFHFMTYPDLNICHAIGFDKSGDYDCFERWHDIKIRLLAITHTYHDIPLSIPEKGKDVVKNQYLLKVF